MGQLSDIGEEDVFEELDLLEHTDLSNVEYMVRKSFCGTRMRSMGLA